MSDNSPQITLDIDSPRITSDMFTRGVNAFFGFTNAVANDVSKKDHAVDWVVSVKHGSVNIIVSPETLNGTPEIVSTTFQALEDGIAIIEAKDERPNHFSDDALRKIQTLASIVDGKNKEASCVKVWINSNKRQLTHHTVANVNSILGTESKAYGSVEGKLHMMADRKGGLRFDIYDRINDYTVKCHFKDEMVDEVTKGFRKRVFVHGLLRYRRDGKIISVEDIDEFKILGEKELPNFYDVLGILKE